MEKTDTRRPSRLEKRALWLDRENSVLVERMSEVSGIPMATIVNRVLAVRLPRLSRQYDRLFGAKGVTCAHHLDGDVNNAERTEKTSVPPE